MKYIKSRIHISYKLFDVYQQEIHNDFKIFLTRGYKFNRNIDIDGSIILYDDIYSNINYELYSINKKLELKQEIRQHIHILNKKYNSDISIKVIITIDTNKVGMYKLKGIV